MRPRVLIAEPDGFSPAAVARLSERCEVELRACDAAGIDAALATHDVVWFRLAHRFDAARLAKATRCRVLATPVTGLDHVDLQSCSARGIRVVSLKGEVEFLRTVRATAELTVALALALLRHVPGAAASVRAGAWDRDAFRGRELYGKTAGLVGMGRLGSIVAGFFRAFGMEVLGVDPRPDFPHALATRVDSLEELLGRADLVSLHVSYDASTHHLIDAGAFAAMRPGAFLVNTSRGGVVDEAALLRALESGRLAGAALDVLQGEPTIDATHPIVAAAKLRDDLLVLPHVGGNTFESFEKTELFLAGRVLEALG